LVFFANAARLVQSLSNNRQTILNKLSSVIQFGGETCIPCGISVARSNYLRYGRSGVQKVLIVLTDGVNNINNNDFNTQISTATAEGTLLFGIGVGPDVDQNQIKSIGSNIIDANGNQVQTAFFSPSFAQLRGILDQVVQATCIDLPTTACGAGCQGFCACQRTCICPDVCDDLNVCTSGTCVPGTGGNGCRYSPIAYSDGNLCTEDFCDPVTGPYYVQYNAAVYCNDSNVCTEDNCDPLVGCSYTDLSNVLPSVNPGGCNDNDSCTIDTCDPASGCAHSAPPPTCLCATKVCIQDRACQVSECDIADGLCKYHPVLCDDHNFCSNDSCDPSLGTNGQCVFTPISCDDNDICTQNLCVPQTGCNYPPVVSTFCDDGDNCTIDSCLSGTGCIHTNVTCDDGDYCTSDECNSFLGCQYPSIECVPEGDCYVGHCNSTKGCYFSQIEGTKADRCGVCNGNGNSCFIGLKKTTAALIGTGLLVGLIIGAVAICAAVGIFGGKKGYDLWMKYQNNIQGASTNPLYNDSGLSGTNPFYDNK